MGLRELRMKLGPCRYAIEKHEGSQCSGEGRQYSGVGGYAHCSNERGT